MGNDEDVLDGGGAGAYFYAGKGADGAPGDDTFVDGAGSFNDRFAGAEGLTVAKRTKEMTGSAELP